MAIYLVPSWGIFMILFKDLVVNGAILISFISVGDLFFFDKLNADRVLKRNKAIFGAMYGLLGITLMLFSVEVSPGILVDFRNLAVVISALYGSPLSAAISACAIVIFRLIYFGTTIPSIAASVTISLVCVGVAFIAYRNMAMSRKWFWAVVYSVVLSGSAIAIFVPNPRSIISYAMGMFVVSLFIYYIAERFRWSSQKALQYRKEAIYDHVTELGNRRYFERSMNSVVNGALQYGEAFAILLVDIDHFKNINDQHGHLAADLVLQELARLFKATCRSIDIVSRYGGDEFAIVLLDSSRETALKIGQRIQTTVQHHKFPLNSGQSLSVTVSVGIACYPDSSSDPEEILPKSDKALYKAKEAGRNRVAIT